MSQTNKIIVLYDAYCVLCNKSIIWIIKNDVNNFFSFAHYKGNFSKINYPELTKIDTISIITKKGDYLQKSEAVLYILDVINKLTFIQKIIKVIPVKTRDLIYDKIAKNRYSLFGKYSTCEIPKPEWKSKFL